MPVDAVLFDLLSGLLDSWSLWDDVAGGRPAGRRWRGRYLELTYATGAYRPYASLVAEAARAEALPADRAGRLLDRWDELRPWPEADAVLQRLNGVVPLGVVTNCSTRLGRRAAAHLDVDWDVLVTAEEAGAYKPRPEPYRLALERLGLAPERVLFVAGSPFDLPGAAGAGMPVWWHNRAHLERRGGPAPLREHDTLEPLPDDVLASR